MSDDDSTADRFDVLAVGLLFFDIVMADLPAGGPVLGREVWTASYGSGPGGIANFAVTTARLGLKTTLAAAIGTDAVGDLAADSLSEAEGIDLSYAPRLRDWPTPVTVALSYDQDRALVTAATEPPAGPGLLLAREFPSTRFAIAHLSREPASWLTSAKRRGCAVFADLGWDPSEAWHPEVLDQLVDCFAFLPNHHEAMNYTGTRTPADAAKVLADRVPVSVVTCGAAGAVGIDSRTGESATVPALPVATVDATGAGDVFGGALVYAFTRDWSLRQRLLFAALASGLSVRAPGGAVSAPRPADLNRWYATISRDQSADGAELARRYRFLGTIPDEGEPAHYKGDS